MQLPFFKKSPSPPQREYLFALEIDHSLLKSAVWGVFNDKPQVLAVGSPVPWDDQTGPSLLAAADQSLSDATNRLDPQGKVSPSKVILGIPPDWLESDKILPAKLQLLKHLSHELSLNIVGYVVTPEAAVKFLQTLDGVPPTAILLGFWPHHLEVTLVRLGKIDAIHEVSRSSKVVDDVVEGLTRFPHVDMLPSRILLYDSGLNLEDLRQQLLAHPWQAPQTHLPFLHFPKIETLPSDFTIRSIALAGGSEVARAIGLLPDPVPTASPATSSPPPQTSSATDLGFSETDTPEVIEPFNSPELQPQPESPQTPAPSVLQKTVHKFSLPNFRLLPLVIIIILAALSVGSFTAFWYLPRATVTLHLTPKPLNSQFDLVADTSISNVDTVASRLPAQAISATLDGSKSAPSTGTKIVGDKATGTVSIINSTPTSKSFSAGTVISSPSGLKFVLNDSVQVASASGTADNISLGKSTVNVTASQIGSDSNLSAGTYFTVGSYATLDVVAKNDTALSGGSSRQVQAVSDADISSLRSALLSSLKSTAPDQLHGQLSGSQIIIPDSVQVQTSSETFDHQSGDAVDQVNLHLVAKASALAISQSDLNNLISDKLGSQIPAGYAFASQTQPTFTVTKSTSSAVSLTAQVSANLVPQINFASLPGALAGLPSSKAVTYLTSLTGVSSADIAFNFPLPPFLRILPHLSSHIVVNTRSD